MPANEECDGLCDGPFIKGLRKHFGKDAELPTGMVMTDGKVRTILLGPMVTTRNARGHRERTYLSLPFCALCGRQRPIHRPIETY